MCDQPREHHSLQHYVGLCMFRGLWEKKKKETGVSLKVRRGVALKGKARVHRKVEKDS